MLAGFAGTALMTAVQLVEMRMRKRAPSTVPAKVVEKLLHVEATDERAELRLANATHFAYGSGWGLARALLRELGLGRTGATLAQFALVWGTELRMLPSMKLVPPVRMWKKQEIAQDLLMHALYASATGVAYDALRSPRTARRLRRVRRALLRHARGLRGLLRRRRARNWIDRRADYSLPAPPSPSEESRRSPT